MVRLSIGQSTIVHAWIPINPTTILVSSDDTFIQAWKNALAQKCGQTQFVADISTAWRMVQKLKSNTELVIIDSPSNRFDADKLYKWCCENMLPVLWLDYTTPTAVAKKDFVQKPIDINVLAQKILTHKRKVTGKALR